MNETFSWGAAWIVLASLGGGGAMAQPPSQDPPSARSADKSEEARGKGAAKPAKKKAKPEPASREERLRRARERIRKAQRTAPPGRGAGRPGMGKGSQGKPMRGMKGPGRPDMRAAADAGYGRGRGRMGRGQVWRRLRRHWPRDVVSPALTAEMRRHARRMAKLSRIGEVAREQSDAKALERVEALMERERARHRRKIGVLSEAARSETAKPSAGENKEER